MRKKILLVIIMLLFIPVCVSAMVMKIVEAPTIVDVQKENDTVIVSLTYHELINDVINHYSGKSNSLNLVIEANINQNGWFECEIDDAYLLNSKKTIKFINGDFNEDAIEFRAMIKDNIGDYLSSMWSDEYVINADKLSLDNEETPLGEVAENHKNTSFVEDPPETCLWNSELCCNSFLNISLCIWIIIAIVLVLLIIGLLCFKKKDIKVKY